MILTTQVTEPYFRKAQGFFESIKRHWPYEFRLGTIDCDGGDYRMEISDVKTYREGYPSNRKVFITPQGGEFIDFLNVPDDEIVIQVDADCIMQRKMSPLELVDLIPDGNEIIATFPCNPPQTLEKVSKNLHFRHTHYFPGMGEYEFCGAFLVARAGTFRRLRDLVVSKFDDLVDVNSHHAGIQFLISYIAYQEFDVRIVSNIYQVGDWYLHNYNFSRDGKNLLLNDEVVIFNHTKFK